VISQVTFTDTIQRQTLSYNFLWNGCRHGWQIGWWGWYL